MSLELQDDLLTYSDKAQRFQGWDLMQTQADIESLKNELQDL